jgi:hypothetical protein
VLEDVVLSREAATRQKEQLEQIFIILVSDKNGFTQLTWGEADAVDSITHTLVFFLCSPG